MANMLISTWKTSINALAIGMEEGHKFYGKPFDKKEWIKEKAKRQLQLINETKPNKKKSLKKQCDKEQLEYVEWLEKVIETGELEQ